MIGTIRKHQTWLWVFIIVAVVVSFVIYFTPGVTLDRSGAPRSAFGSMNGRAIERKQYMIAYNEARIRQFLRSGQWPDSGEARRMGFDLDRQARERLVLMDRMERLGIEVPDATVAAWIQDNFSNPSQPGSARQMYDTLVRELARRGVTESDLARYIRHEIGIGHLLDLTAVASSLVTPREAEARYRQQNERLQAEAAVFSHSNHLAAVHLDPERLATWFTNRQHFYRAPEKVQVQYVRFDATNFLAQAETILARRTNLVAEIEARYLQAGASRFIDTNGQVMPPDAAKARIREQMLQEDAKLAARKEAALFGTELEKLQPASAENLATLAQQKGLPVNTTAPFSEIEGPREIRARQDFTRTAFSLTPERPLSRAIVGEDAVFILALQARFPSEIPALDTVRDRVTQDFRREEAMLLARQSATNFVTTLTNGLAAGKTFTELATQAGATWLGLPTFGPGSRNLEGWDRRVNLEQVKLVTANLQTNTTSGPILSADGAFVLFLKSREPAADTEVKEALASYLKELQDERRFEGFSEWFRRQIELTRIDMPAPEAEAP